MRILLTNDDGINAPGLAALHGAAAGLGQIDVVAPAAAESGASHAVTFHRPLIARRQRVEGRCGAAGFEGYSVDGRPADCVKLALARLVERPDLIISGINAGSNMGIHSLYSGTVAAAREGAIAGIPSIAMSLYLTSKSSADWALAGTVAHEVLVKLVAGPLDPHDLLNVNIPILDGRKAPRGWRVVPASTVAMIDEYHSLDEAESDPPGRGFTVTDHLRFHQVPIGSDVALPREGFVTVTPLHFDLTDYNRLRLWSDHLS
jgi:5'-nucleotidase